MKKIVAVAIIVMMLLVSGCADKKTIDGIEYDTYGLLNRNEKENPDIQYEIVWGNVIWGAILSETIVAPIYFFGFSIWEPVGKRMPIKGQVSK